MQGASFTYNSTRKTYAFNWTGEDIAPFVKIPLSNLPSDNFKISFDYIETRKDWAYRGRICIGIGNGTNAIAGGLQVLNNEFDSYIHLINVKSFVTKFLNADQKDKWYHCEWTLKNNIVTIKAFYNDELVYSETQDISSYSYSIANPTHLEVRTGLVRSTVEFKNIYVEPL